MEEERWQRIDYERGNNSRRGEKKKRKRTGEKLFAVTRKIRRALHRAVVGVVSHQIIMDLIMASDGLRHHDFHHPNKNCYVIKNMQQQHATDFL